MCLRLHSAVPLRDKALEVLRRDDIISLGWCLPFLSQDRDALLLRYTPRDRRRHHFNGIPLCHTSQLICFYKVVHLSNCKKKEKSTSRVSQKVFFVCRVTHASNFERAAYVCGCMEISAQQTCSCTCLKMTQA